MHASTDGTRRNILLSVLSAETMRAAALVHKTVSQRLVTPRSPVRTTSAVPFRGAVPVASTIRASSTAAASAPRRRRMVDDKDPIIVTPRAQDRIQELLQNKPEAVGIRLGVRRRGCNGLSYTLNYAERSEDHSKNISMETDRGIKVWIEPMALFNIVGTTMDWEETELSSEFTFNNPNSKGSCGCGESFNV